MSFCRLLSRNNHGSSGRKLATVIVQQMAAVIPNLVTQIHQAIPINAVNINGNPGDTNSTGHMKRFNSCKPTQFCGNEGAT